MPKAKRARRPAPKTKALSKGKKSPVKKAAAGNVDAYVRRLSAPMQLIVNQLRALVAAAAPEATETFKWGQPVYEVNGPMAYLKAYKTFVNFGFWRGALLEAPEGVLAGDGARMRHVKLSSLESIREDVLQPLIRQAALLNERLGDPTRR